jgi:hypothetical protein
VAENRTTTPSVTGPPPEVVTWAVIVDVLRPSAKMTSGDAVTTTNGGASAWAGAGDIQLPNTLRNANKMQTGVPAKERRPNFDFMICITLT